LLALPTVENKATQGVFNVGNIGVLAHMRLTVPSICMTPSSTISVPFSKRQM
jgi:hypothetical protein